MKRNIFNIAFLVVIIFFYVYFEFIKSDNINTKTYTLSDIEDYSGEDIIILNNNEPNFDLSKSYDESFEEYGPLDELGRCTYAFANVGSDLMPTKDRERISNVKPTGWHYSKYEFIEEGILYNRCHLIAYQLTAENDNKNNLITCTRHTNYDLMRDYEHKIGNYVRKTNNHVLYRVTPIFDYDNLIAKGIELEAYSVEDNGKGIKFNVFIYNIQPGIYIDYKTGDNHEVEKK